MSEEPTRRDRAPAPKNPDEEAAVRWVGAAPEAAPSPEARERARAAFLSGDASGAAVRLAPILTPRRLPWTRVAVAAAAAAVLVWGLSPADDWTVTAAEGTASLGGRETRPEHRVRAGLAATGADSWLETRLGDRLLLRVAPESRVELPPGPGRWLRGPRTLLVTEGEVYASTGGTALGFPLRIETPEAVTTIVGTTLAVRRNEFGTCVCLLEGRIELDGKHGERVSVPAGRRIQIFSDGAEPRVEELTSEETALLKGLHDRQQSAI